MNFQPDWNAIGVVVNAVGALATAAIGWAAVRIARGQTKAALFDRRFKAYRDLSAGVAAMQIDGAVYPSTYETLKEAVHLARFLYGSAVAEPLEELQQHSYHAWLLRPLENQGRSNTEYEKAGHHMQKIDSLWSSVKPMMERSLRTWASHN